MTQDTRTTKVETVVVTVNDQVLDCVSFSDKKLADLYRGSVRTWALQRGVVVRLWTQELAAADKIGPGEQERFAMAG